MNSRARTEEQFECTGILSGCMHVGSCFLSPPSETPANILSCASQADLSLPGIATGLTWLSTYPTRCSPSHVRLPNVPGAHLFRHFLSLSATSARRRIQSHVDINGQSITTCAYSTHNAPIDPCSLECRRVSLALVRSWRMSEQCWLDGNEIGVVLHLFVLPVFPPFIPWLFPSIPCSQSSYPSKSVC